MMSGFVVAVTEGGVFHAEPKINFRLSGHQWIMFPNALICAFFWKMCKYVSFSGSNRSNSAAPLCCEQMLFWVCNICDKKEYFHLTDICFLTEWYSGRYSVIFLIYSISSLLRFKIRFKIPSHRRHFVVSQKV